MFPSLKFLRSLIFSVHNTTLISPVLSFNSILQTCPDFPLRVLKDFGFEILLIIPTIAGWDLPGSKSPISKISPLDF